MARRTTVTLDDDVAAKLEQEARERGESVRAVLNEALRRGLNPPPRRSSATRFRVTGPFARRRQGVSFDNVEELLDQVEGPLRK